MRRGEQGEGDLGLGTFSKRNYLFSLLSMKRNRKSKTLGNKKDVKPNIYIISTPSMSFGIAVLDREREHGKKKQRGSRREQQKSRGSNEGALKFGCTTRLQLLLLFLHYYDLTVMSPVVDCHKQPARRVLRIR